MRQPILTLGKYEIMDAVGSGGMATVYRARVAGPMGFEKPVAVKVLQDEAAEDADVVRMFIDEARLGARLSHPNITSILDFGEADGRYFMAMEFVDGASLSVLLKHGGTRKNRRLQPNCAVHVTASILRALAYAHTLTDEQHKPMGIVHRDISPQNVLLDHVGTVKLCDFGIATGSYRLEHTRAGVIKGKTAYMAPEQATGESVDARSDLYGVGLTLFAMLNGAPAFEGHDASEIQQQAAEGVPSAKVDELDCSDELKAVLTRALALAPDDRFDTADAFLRALSTAAPDPEEAGQRALVDKLQGLSQRSLKPRNTGKKVPVTTATQSACIEATTRSLRETRILLFAIGGVILLALLLALLGVGLPDPS